MELALLQRLPQINVLLPARNVELLNVFVKTPTIDLEPLAQPVRHCLQLITCVSMFNHKSIPLVLALQRGAYTCMYCFTELIFKHRLVTNAY